MTKLKTLKDLSKERNKNAFNCYQCFERIKAEAVKWVKMFRERNDDGTGDYWRAIAFISFFNLTEEDLKESKEVLK